MNFREVAVNTAKVAVESSLPGNKYKCASKTMARALMVCLRSYYPSDPVSSERLSKVVDLIDINRLKLNEVHLREVLNASSILPNLVSKY